MSLIRYLLYLSRQLVGYTVSSRRPLLLMVVLAGGVVAAVGTALHAVAPLAIYPFL